MQTEIINEVNAVIPALRTPDAEISDRVLVEQAKEGSRAAFGQLVERYKGRVFRVAKRTAYSHEDAEEIVQDAFVKAFKNLSQFRGDSSFYTWLVRITINEGLMKARRHRPCLVSIDAPANTEERIPPREIEDRGPTPEQTYSRRELRSILSSSINRLAPRYRMVVHLSGFEGLSTSEIARALDLSHTAVKSRLRRARLQLRDSLDAYF